MPDFELISEAEAKIISATGKRAEITKEYLGYIGQLQEGQAGRLQAIEGETPGAVRRRLGAAAKLAEKDLVIKRAEDVIYFWLTPEPAKSPRRRGRPRNADRPIT